MLSKNKIKFINSLKTKKYRDKYHLFIAEGNKLISEILKSNLSVNTLIATKKWLDNEKLNFIKSTKEVIEVNQNELKKVSSLKTPSDVLAIVQIPLHNTINKEETINNLSLVLDNIQDPGNLGTIIRTADWFGIQNIFCSDNSVDIYNPKVIQATMGAICRVKVHYVNLITFLKKYSKIKDFPVYGTFLKGDNIYKQALKNKGLIIFGNESKGISKELNTYISQKLFIPDFSKETEKPENHFCVSESLNISTAAAIICSEFRRRR